MKTTFDLPDDLVIAAKKKAADLKKPLRDLVEAGLRQQLAAGPVMKNRRKKFRWVVADGGIPKDLDLSNREKMYEWLGRRR